MNGTNGYGRRRAGIYLAMTVAMALLGALALGGCKPRGKAMVEITEVVSSNALSYMDGEFGAVDWIELHNAGTASVSLGGWFLTDKYSSLDGNCSLPPITLAPDGYCLILADKNLARSGSRCLPFGLSREGETLYLFTAEGEEAAKLQVPSLEKDVSWAKKADGTYGYCLLPTPGQANDTEILDHMPATQPDEGPREPADLEISEVVSSNGTSYAEKPYGAVDWIELHNRSDEQISLQGWILSDKSAVSESNGVLPDVTIPADGYYIILADADAADKGDRCLPFSVNKAGETLYLFAPSGQQAAAVEVPALDKDVSWALAADGRYGYCLCPTPGEPNTADITATAPTAEALAARQPSRKSQAAVRINEVCSAPQGKESDWIELYNPADQAADVGGFCLTDDAADPTKGVLPALTVPAKGYLLVPLGPAADPAAGCPALSLSSKGDRVYLFDDGLGLADALEVPALQEGLVYARAEDGTFGYCGVPTPGAANDPRIYDAPLRPMAADAPLHINEALFRNKYSAIDSFGDHSDWVELVNRSGKTLSLGGYYLSDKKDEPRQWALPDVELKPGAYLLVFLSGRDQASGELHASFSVSERDDGLCLYDSRTLEMEFLPYPKDLKENVSLGLDGKGELIYFGYPTPGFANAAAFPSQEACGLPGGDVLISEVSAGGSDGEWIELYNRGTRAVNLSGWHLSDDQRTPEKLALGDIRLDPKGYYAISLEKGSDASPFSISLSGEELVLTDKHGVVRDVFATGALRQGITSGRQAEDPDCRRVFYAASTRGQPNGAAMAGYAATPVFSETALYHNAAFQLVLTAGPGTEIHYTLDGSAPTKKSPVYDGPLTIRDSAIVRAVGMAEGRFDSQEAVATYLFRQAHTLPVVAIAADPDRWKELTHAPFQEAGLKEQPAVLCFYEADGSLGAFFPAGISPRGNASLGYPQKSMSVHLRGAYGQSSVTYPFWADGVFLPYTFLVLRNGSQDIRAARLRDSFANRAAANLKVMTVKTRPVIVYVNGAYYGIMDLNEGMNHDYLWTHYGVEGDKVNFVQRNDHVKRGSAEGFVALRQFASRKNMADDEVYAEFCRQVDMDALIDYIIAQSFFGNYDIHNQNWWSSTDGTVPWQPILYDIDRCLNKESLRSNVLGMYFNTHGVVHNKKGDRILMEIPCGLKKNAAWRQRFVERYAQLLCTDLSAERLTGLLDDMAAALRPEMGEHTARWKMPDSVKSWEENVSGMRTNILRQHEKIQNTVKRQFSVSDQAWAELLAKYGK